MKILSIILLFVTYNYINVKNTPMNNVSESTLYSISINSIENKKMDLKSFQGKKILFVNVASECGYTPQYKDLQSLYEKHGEKLTVIGVPCNQFGKQEPGTSEEIVTFCEKNYGVTFPLTEKVEVKGENQHPLYQWLTLKSKNGMEDSKVKWNFTKYLVDENGNLISSFDSGVNPLDDKIVSLL